MQFEDAVKLAKRLGLAGVLETSAKEGTQSLEDAFLLTSVLAFDGLSKQLSEQ